MSSAVVNDTIYVFGGNISEHINQQDVYTNDFFSITIKHKIAHCKQIFADSILPPKRLSHSLSNLNNKFLIVFGGESHDEALNDVWTYSIESNIWHEIKPKNLITARMAHVSFCYKDSFIVFGGMSADQTVKSDLAVLEFGKSGININNGSGVHSKRKFSKILNVTARTVPIIPHSDSDNFSVFCNKCSHSFSTCEFLEKFPEIGYPVLNFSPRLQISSDSVDQLSCLFQDPFGAMIKIGQSLNTSAVSFSIVGTVNMRGNQICKMLQSDASKNNFFVKSVDGNQGKNAMLVPILEISSKQGLPPEVIVKMCSGVSSFTLIPAFFKLSDTVVIISRTLEYLSVALMHKTELYVPLFFSVFDKNGEPVYPSKDLVYPSMVNVYSRSHLQSVDVFRRPLGLSIFLYPKDLESIVGDIL